MKNASTVIVAGVDYSMSSPAICIHSSNGEWSDGECKFYFRSDKKKVVEATFAAMSPVFGTLIQPFKTQEQRFRHNAEWVRTTLEQEAVNFVCLEGYAMGAKGQVFSIGENTGLIKQVFDQLEIPFITPPPTLIKKFASGKGNAKKDDMEVAFIDQTGIDMRQWLGGTQSSISFNPSSDLIDAYFLTKYAFYKIHELL